MSTGCLRFLVVLILTVGAAAAQSLSYRLLPADGPQPSARFDGTIAWHSTRKLVYLFGGQDSSSRNDLWTYSIDEGRWSAVEAGGTKPPARFGHTLVADRRGRLIVFGGQSSGFFSDVWAFDPAAGSWQQLGKDETGPSRRYGHSAVYDESRDRMVISHGFTDSGRFDDTWAFEFATNTWRNLTPSGAKPLRRCLHHAVLDSARDQMYLYGGCASGFGPCPLGDLWAFDLKTNQWIERTSGTKPPARQYYGRSFDVRRNRMLIFGGSGPGLLNDTWSFDPAAAVWQEGGFGGEAPPPRNRHESTYVPETGMTLFFGGVTRNGTVNELWSLGPPADTRPVFAAGGIVNAFGGRAGPIAPGQIVSIYGRALGPQTGMSFAFEGGRLPISGSGVSVTFNGLPAPLLYARADQLNVQVPYDLPPGTQASVVVTTGEAASAPVPVDVLGASPGLSALVFHADGSLNSEVSAARPGDVVVLYATGQGMTVPASQTGEAAREPYPQPAGETVVRIGGLPAELLFRGQAPGTAGVMQVNARIPQSLTTGSHSVVLSVSGVESGGENRIAIR